MSDGNLLLRLPSELLANVLQDLRASGAEGASALAALASTCKALNEIATPVLYSRLVLTRRNAAHLFLGLQRSAPAKTVTRTKAEWDAQLAAFAEEYSEIIRDEDQEFEGESEISEDAYSDSDPETDDEYAPELETIKKETTVTSWKRRLELFKWTTRLDIVQAPTRAISTDLAMATKAWVPRIKRDEEEGYWLTKKERVDDDEEEDEEDDGHEDAEDEADDEDMIEKMDTDEDKNADNDENEAELKADSNDETNDEHRDKDTDNDEHSSDAEDKDRVPTTLFPNLERLSLSARVVRYLGGTRLISLTDDTDQISLMTKEARPFLDVLSRAIGTPAHVCMTSTHERVDRTEEHAFRRIRRPADTIEERHVQQAVSVDVNLPEDGKTLLQIVQELDFLRDDKIQSLTVHGIRHALCSNHWVLDNETRTTLPFTPPNLAPHLTTYRFMYPSTGAPGDSTEERARGIVGHAIRTAPVFPGTVTRVEHVGVGNAVRNDEHEDEDVTADPDVAAEVIATKAFPELIASVDGESARFCLVDDFDVHAFVPEDNDADLDAAYQAAQAVADAARAEYNARPDLLALADVNARLADVRAIIQVQRDSPNGIEAGTRAEEAKLRAEASRLAIAVAKDARDMLLMVEPKEKAAKAALDAVDEARFANREQRLAALFPSPLERVVFTPTAQAEPCVVCGGKGHGDDWTLAELLEHAYK